MMPDTGPHARRRVPGGGTTRAPRSVGLRLALASLLLTLAGCAADSGAGYTTEPLFERDVRSVAVNILGNASFRRGVEFSLTEALIKEIETRTPYKVTRQGTADTIITGTIRGVDQGLLSRDADAGVPQEIQVTVTASFQWKDQRTGEVLRRRDGMAATGEYVPTRPAGEFYEVAEQRAVAEMARHMVDLMRSDW